MTDIAMLVAEEYERRMSNSGKSGGAYGEDEVGLASCVSVLAKGFGGSSSWLKNKIGQEKMEMLKWVLEPRSQIGLAAFNGFFSA
ncbi:hypothetical protein L1049_001932 [Liquidambar formosana]|uniref:Uncharacterized protein n=1 Tax=Liquidambar formosana TaxID=63359 RepID=A0AAP0NG48_LIQFO